MKHVSFDEIVRNLLVYLKGQVPSLNSKDSREDVMRQVQSIAMTLRSTIVQLEGAASSDTRNSDEFQNLQKELSSLKSTNAKLEESLFLEMNKTQDYSEKLTAVKNIQEVSEKQLKQYEEQINKLQKDLEILGKQKIQEIQVPTIDESLYQDLKQQIADLENALAASNSIIAELQNQPPAAIDQSVFDELKNEIVRLESIVSKDSETIKNLRQALQNKEIELSKNKDIVTELIESGKTAKTALQQQQAELEKAVRTNKTHLERIAEMERELKNLPSLDVYQNNMAATEAKIKYLEKALLEAQGDNQKLRQSETFRNAAAFQNEKQQLEQRIIDLEATLRNVIKSRESSSRADKFAFTPEECVFLFETLSTTANRLSQSPENRDIHARSCDSIAILEKSNAIQRIPTVGEFLDLKVHKPAKSFKNDFLPDGIIIHEESPGFVSGTRLVQKAVVWVGKSVFNCNECHNICRAHEFFCPKCGLELTAPDGTSKRDLAAHPTFIDLNLHLIDILIKHGNLKAATALTSFISKEHPDNPELAKRKALLLNAENAM